jgi:hypothetical protein
MTTPLDRAAILFSALFLTACAEQPPQWCVAACEHDGGIGQFSMFKPRRTISCWDGMIFFEENAWPEKRVAHGGVRDAPPPTSNGACFCKSGGFVTK